MSQKSQVSSSTIALSLCLFLLTSLVMCNYGCAPLQPGADPVVVRAEQTTAISFEFIDGFLKWEKANQAVAGPVVHAQAEIMRKNAPQWLTTARLLTKAYKANRTPENKANLLTALAVLEAAQSVATEALSKKVNP